MDSLAKNNSGVKIIITKKLEVVVKIINESLNTRIYNIQFEVSSKALVVINLSNIDRYFIVHS